MYLVGLTGNIGTGKSTVGALLAERGARVVDADLVYRDLIQPGEPGWMAVVELFGREILLPDDQIDRRALGGIVFRDPAALRRLEVATHPLVLARIDAILDRERPRVAVHEAIKLIESGGADRCDELWVVTALRQTQIDRLMAQRGMSRQDAELRVDAQPPQEEKARLADVVLENDGSVADLRRRVALEWSRIEASLAASGRS